MSQLKVLAPQNASLSNLIDCSPLCPFHPLVLTFLTALSNRLLSKANKQHAELVALGFWLRNANIKKLEYQQGPGWYKALGLVVHFTPANVDTMFIYSWVCSLLMGNNNIIRVASSDSASKTLLLEELNGLFADAEFSDLAQRNLFVTYAKESQYSAQLSLWADARVIWGGDDSVNAIRALPIKPRCRDISFADRYSAALINGDALVAKAQVAELATLLWRDTQPHAQQACSSPRVIFWLGNNEAQQALFEKVEQLAAHVNHDNTSLNNHLAVSQLIQSSGCAGKPIVQKTICALPIKTLNQAFLDWHLGGGLYLVLSLTTLNELPELIDEKLQTLTYWQVDKSELLKLVNEPSITGLDRVVPLGRALEFSPHWDGVDLLSQLSRTITVY